MVCTGPVSYRGEEALAKDIANLQAAAKDKGVEDVFIARRSPPSGAGLNEHYGSEDEYFTPSAKRCGTNTRPSPTPGFSSADRRIRSSQDIYSDGGPRRAAARGQGRSLSVEAINEAFARHSGRAGPLPHLLRHQRGAADLRSELKDVVGHMLKVKCKILFVRRRKTPVTSTSITSGKA